MTSLNALGSTLLFVTFDLDRSIDHAARDVQAALNAATTDLPAGLPNVPTFRKANPDDVPILILALTSNTLSASALYDAADSVLLQRLSQIDGVAAVSVAGADQPAIRVSAYPSKLAAMGLSLDDVRAAIVNANALSPIGSIEGETFSRSIAASGQLSAIDDYRNLVVKTVEGSSVLLSDVASVENGKRNIHAEASFDGRPAILVSITKASGANVIQTVKRVTALLPQLDRFLPAGVEISVLHDRAVNIRASVDNMIEALILAIALVMIVVLIFLRRMSSIIAAGITVPLALAGTCACMYAAGFSVDNISLMAVATSIGFVVDDAVVMIENIETHREAGMSPFDAALIGSRQVWFTLVAMSASLMAAFIPLLWLGGVTGRLFREFSVTLAFAVVVSTLASLTVTPVICGHFGRRNDRRAHLGLVPRLIETTLDSMRSLYGVTLGAALRHEAITGLVFLSTVAITIWLYADAPKTFFPKQDSDLVLGSTEAPAAASYQVLEGLQRRVAAAILSDPAVEDVGSTLGSSGGRTSPANQGRLFIALKPRKDRADLSTDEIIARLRSKVLPIVGINTYLQSLQELQTGGPAAKSPQQLILTDQNYGELIKAYSRIVDRLRQVPGIVDVSDDHGSSGLQTYVSVNRMSASRVGVTMASIDNALDNSFSQRQIATIYGPRNQYRVVLGVPLDAQREPGDILDTYVPAGVTPLASSGLGGGVTQAGLSAASQLAASQRAGYQAVPTAQIRLATIARTSTNATPLSINHQDQFPSISITYALAAGLSEVAANRAVSEALAEMHLPSNLHTRFGGAAELSEGGTGSEVLLIVIALATIYLVLGILYESLLQPITILSTLPAAGLGALLALRLTDASLDRIAFIGILLTISIVKKNGIMMIDFALDAERRTNAIPRDAIRRAAMERFRPILMTTLASVLGAIPLVVASGAGSALRRPLGITIIGGLLVAQILTLYTTPVIYLYVGRIGLSLRRIK